MSPELSTALHRAAQYGLRAQDIREYLQSSIQASHHAVLHANQAWIQLETLGVDMLSIAGAVDMLGTGDIQKAVKDAKVTTRDRVIMYAMGRFRSVLDVFSIMEYLSDLVKRSNTPVSQLRNAFYKVQSEFVMNLICNVEVFEKFARHLCNNTDDNDMQPVIYNLNHFGVLDFNPDQFYTSLMRWPSLVKTALLKSQSNASSSSWAGSATASATSAVFDSYKSLGQQLAYADFLQPVEEAMKASAEMGLWAIQHAVAAWAEFQYATQSMSSKIGGDGTRKLRELDYRLQREVAMTVFAFMGGCAVSDFSCLEHVLRFEIVTKDTLYPEDLEVLISKLQSSHCRIQKELLQELISSEDAWARTVQTVEKKSEM